MILFKYEKTALFNRFIEDTLDKLEIISLSEEKYKEIVDINNKYKLDFDDAYQFLVSKENEMIITTQDNDFKKVDGLIKLNFL